MILDSEEARMDTSFLGLDDPQQTPIYINTNNRNVISSSSFKTFTTIRINNTITITTTITPSLLQNHDNHKHHHHQHEN